MTTITITTPIVGTHTAFFCAGLHCHFPTSWFFRTARLLKKNLQEHGHCSTDILTADTSCMQFNWKEICCMQHISLQLNTLSVQAQAGPCKSLLGSDAAFAFAFACRLICIKIPFPDAALPAYCYLGTSAIQSSTILCRTILCNTFDCLKGGDLVLPKTQSRISAVFIIRESQLYLSFPEHKTPRKLRFAQCKFRRGAFAASRPRFCLSALLCFQLLQTLFSAMDELCFQF